MQAILANLRLFPPTVTVLTLAVGTGSHNRSSIRTGEMPKGKRQVVHMELSQSVTITNNKSKWKNLETNMEHEKDVRLYGTFPKQGDPTIGPKMRKSLSWGLHKGTPDLGKPPDGELQG